MTRVPRRNEDKWQEEASLAGSIQSLKKAAAILNLFTEDDKTYGISEMAKILELPKPTVQGLVRTLEEIGYLEKEESTSKYMLGSALLQLGIKYMTNMDLTVIARSWMERLCLQFKETARVGMLIGKKVVIVMRIDSENKYMVYPQVGSVIPYHTSGLAKVILAYMDDAERDAMLKDYVFRKFTDRSIDNRKDFIAELTKVRKTGIGLDLQESVPGLSCVSGPLFNNKRQCIAAVSVSGNSDNIERNLEEVKNAIRYVSAQVSAQLGYRKEEAKALRM